ncbi:MAG: DegT/DnrJ/EryC1/StrS aminotransferase [Deltaproteobacteria bacterium RBG_13_47_9]|nr:MAG: DegT/DnrJ/EryC1/StrS aminotransferase [Deltaproteobacteria bacterium RBG_13_47_9]
MDWKVPLSDIDFGPEEIDGVKKVLASKWLATGEVTARFEKEFANFVGVKHAIAVSNCTAALHLACHILGIGPGDEVILPSLTFVATANAVLYCGGTPVFADITDERDLHISVDDVERKITPKTKAITVVHYGGYCCDMERFANIARAKKLFLIEDAAHVPGGYFNGKHAGTFGQFGCFSFFPNKNMTTAEGGMLITDDDELAGKARPARSHGLTTMTWDRHRGHAYSYDVPTFGFNYRIDEIRSSIGLAQLAKLRPNNERRGFFVSTYMRGLEGLDEIRIPFKDRIGGSEKEKPSYHLFPILVKDEVTRNFLMEDLKKQGIQTSIHYPPIHLFSYYKSTFKLKEGMLPKTEQVSKRLLTLPLYGSMEEKQVRYVVDSIKKFFGKQ